MYMPMHLKPIQYSVNVYLHVGYSHYFYFNAFDINSYCITYCATVEINCVRSCHVYVGCKEAA